MKSKYHKFFLLVIFLCMVMISTLAVVLYHENNEVKENFVESKTYLYGDYITQIELNIASGNYEEAENILKKALVLEPHKTLLLQLGSKILYRRGNFSDAITLLERGLIPSDHRDPILLNNYGICLWRIKKYEEAFKCLIEAYKISGRSAFIRANAIEISRRSKLTLPKEFEAPKGEWHPEYTVSPAGAISLIPMGSSL